MTVCLGCASFRMKGSNIPSTRSWAWGAENGGMSSCTWSVAGWLSSFQISCIHLTLSGESRHTVPDTIRTCRC